MEQRSSCLKILDKYELANRKLFLDFSAQIFLASDSVLTFQQLPLPTNLSTNSHCKNTDLVKKLIHSWKEVISTPSWKHQFYITLIQKWTCTSLLSLENFWPVSSALFGRPKLCDIMTLFKPKFALNQPFSTSSSGDVSSICSNKRCILFTFPVSRFLHQDNLCAHQLLFYGVK